MGQLARRSLRLAVVGGGPAGLFFALLAKQRMPQHEIVVYERNAADATFGFGVVFSEQTLGGFAGADAQLQQQMADAGVSWTDIEVRRDDGAMRCGGHGFSAISRRRLLALMQARARAVGAQLHFEHEATAEELSNADLVIACDGVNSALRDRYRDALEPSVSSGSARYIWFATPQRFDALTMIFVKNAHGTWGAHAYPFEDGASTFIIETDVDTWRRAGLDGTGDLAPGDSDLVSKRYCEELFAHHLHGHSLMVNNSKWMQFRTLRCSSWHTENVVLLGDAAHTAHFSVGSGTKMAMEDALALADAIEASDDIGESLLRYEAARRTSVEYIQAAARPSLIWWERFRHVIDRDLEQFALHFFTRSPIVSRERLLARDRRFVRRVERWAQAAGVSADGPLSASVEVGGLRLPSRVVASAPAEFDPLVGLGGLAITGSGLVMTRTSRAVREALAWVHHHTDAAAGLRIESDADPGLVEQAQADGFDVLEAPLGARAALVWPADQVLLSVVETPEDAESTAGDRLIEALSAMAVGRLLIAGVTTTPGRDLTEALLLCDRIVEETGLTCAAVDILLDNDSVQTAILSGRVQLVQAVPSVSLAHWKRTSEYTTATTSEPR
jgi:anthraniloyl-CoA monooxygenase